MAVTVEVKGQGECDRMNGGEVRVSGKVMGKGLGESFSFVVSVRVRFRFRVSVRVSVRVKGQG